MATGGSCFTAEETKERRADERRVPDFLAAHLDRYHSHHRLTLARGNGRSTAFWISSHSGKPLSYAAIEKIVTETTALTTGVRVSPHLFRTSAATTAAIHAGATPHLASALLDHRDSKTTQQHYNRASSLGAGKAYLEVARAYLDS